MRSYSTTQCEENVAYAGRFYKATTHHNIW